MKRAAQPSDAWGPALPENRTGRYARAQLQLSAHTNGFSPEDKASGIALRPTALNSATATEKNVHSDVDDYEKLYDNEGFRF